MADVKISALPAAGTLTSADVLPLVQGASTTKVSLTQLDTRWVSAATGGTVNGGLTVNPYLAVGTNPAQVGVLRLPNNQWITVRNAANTADLGVVGLTSANQFDVGTTGYQYNINGTRVHIVSALSLGTNPASTGIVRLPTNQYVVGRNNANTADIPLIGVSDVVDRVQIGTTNGQVTFPDGLGINAGTDVGLQISRASNQKIGFYGVNPVARLALAPAAIDPASTMALVNQLRSALISIGLFQ